MKQQLELDLKLPFSPKLFMTFAGLIALPLITLSLLPEKAQGGLEPKTQQEAKLKALVEELADQPSDLLTQAPNSAQMEGISTAQGSSTNMQPEPPPPLAEPPAQMRWVDYTVKKGDTLARLLKPTALNASDIHQLAYETPHGRELVNLRPGEVIRVGTLNDEVKSIEYNPTPLISFSYTNEQGQFTSEKRLNSHQKTQILSQFTIENSLFVDGAKSGLSDNMLYKLMQIFAYDIDFALDLRQGDQFRVVYDAYVLENGKMEPGKILAAEYINKRKNIKALAYAQKEQINYYTPEGRSLKKGFIRTPVKIGYISSAFNPNRRHPVLNTIRAHKGTDYAAPVGTPIYATADGKISFKGWQNGYGNTLIVQHAGGISTLYAHISKFQRGLAKNQKIKQGQIIAYVGQTGLASGPHLHYEFRVNGQHKDPVKVKLPSAPSLSGKDLLAFKSATLEQLSQLDSMNPTALARQ
jgi:murein DD-endopeptidase MepM/ murein hydrolase activator NlpD